MSNPDKVDSFLDSFSTFFTKYKESNQSKIQFGIIIGLLAIGFIAVSQPIPIVGFNSSSINLSQISFNQSFKALISSSSGLVHYNNSTGIITDTINISGKFNSTAQITGLDTQLYNKVNTPLLNHDGTSGQFLITNGEGNTTWSDTAPSGSAITYFLHNDTLTGVPYSTKIMNQTFNTSSPLMFINYTSLPNGNTFIQNWTSPSMNINLIPLGIHTLHINALKIGGASKTVKLYYECGIVTLDGGNFSLRGTSILSDEVTISDTEIHINMNMEDQNINLTDRMVIKVWANQTGGGGNADLQLRFDDLTDARLIFPSIPTDLTPILNNISILQSQVTQLQQNDTNSSIILNNNVTSSRLLNTLYTNSNIKSMVVFVTARFQISLAGGSGIIWGNVSNLQSSGKIGIESGLLNDDFTQQLSFIVCPNCNYAINSSTTNAIVTLNDVREVLI